MLAVLLPLLQLGISVLFLFTCSQKDKCREGTPVGAHEKSERTKSSYAWSGKNHNSGGQPGSFHEPQIPSGLRSVGTELATTSKLMTAGVEAPVEQTQEAKSRQESAEGKEQPATADGAAPSNKHLVDTNLRDTTLIQTNTICTDMTAASNKTDNKKKNRTEKDGEPSTGSRISQKTQPDAQT